MVALLPLEKMSVTDKLCAMDALWEDLRRTPGAVVSPAWHADVLAERTAKIKSGKASFTDWPEAKRKIRERAR